MADQGTVDPKTVIHVLKNYLGAANVKATGNLVTVISDGNPRVYQLAAKVTRRVVQHIAHRHGIPSHFFYHPEMLAVAPKAKQ